MTTADPEQLLPGAALALAAMVDIGTRVDAFCADLRAQEIHVGVNGRCVTCRTDWPCQEVEPDPAMQAYEAGKRTHQLLEEATPDEVLEQLVAEGWMEHAGVDDDDGAQLYRLTSVGKARVEAMGGPGPADA